MDSLSLDIELLLDGVLSDDNDIRDKAEVSYLATARWLLYVYWCSQEKFNSLSLDGQLKLLVSVFAKTTVEQVGKTVPEN